VVRTARTADAMGLALRWCACDWRAAVDLLIDARWTDCPPRAPR
jgi:hypothetical protein